jgi:hypothetical protein
MAKFEMGMIPGRLKSTLTSFMNSKTSKHIRIAFVREAAFLPSTQDWAVWIIASILRSLIGAQ